MIAIKDLQQVNICDLLNDIQTALMLTPPQIAKGSGVDVRRVREYLSKQDLSKGANYTKLLNWCYDQLNQMSDADLDEIGCLDNIIKTESDTEEFYWTLTKTQTIDVLTKIPCVKTQAGYMAISRVNDIYKDMWLAKIKRNNQMDIFDMIIRDKKRKMESGGN